MYVCIYVCMFVCVFIYECMYVCTYVYIYICMNDKFDLKTPQQLFDRAADIFLIMFSLHYILDLVSAIVAAAIPPKPRILKKPGTDGEFLSQNPSTMGLPEKSCKRKKVFKIKNENKMFNNKQINGNLFCMD